MGKPAARSPHPARGQVRYDACMRYFLAALVLLNLLACSSMQAVSIRDQQRDPPADVRKGDRVEVTTRDNEKMEFSVTELNEHGLGGRFGFIPYEKMRRLRVEQPGSGEVPEWIWVAVGVVAAAALIASADSVKVCSPGPCPQPEPSNR